MEPAPRPGRAPVRDGGLAEARAEAAGTDGELYARLTPLPDADPTVLADPTAPPDPAAPAKPGAPANPAARADPAVPANPAARADPAVPADPAAPAAPAVPWRGPRVDVVAHRAHAPGHAALVIEDVLIAGDMCSDVEVPLLDLDAADPLGDYHHALDLFDALAADVRHVVPGHGHVGDRAELRRRLAADRRYLDELAAGRGDDDPRLTTDWLIRDHRAQRTAVHAPPR